MRILKCLSQTASSRELVQVAADDKLKSRRLGWGPHRARSTLHSPTSQTSQCLSESSHQGLPLHSLLCRFPLQYEPQAALSSGLQESILGRGIQEKGERLICSPGNLILCSSRSFSVSLSSLRIQKPGLLVVKRRTKCYFRRLSGMMLCGRDILETMTLETPNLVYKIVHDNNSKGFHRHYLM